MSGPDFLGVSILVNEPEVAIREVDHYARRVVVKGRLFVRAVMDIYDLHVFIFKG
jgi:hypothetical protein